MWVLTLTFGIMAVISVGIFIYGHTEAGKEWIKNI